MKHNCRVEDTLPGQADEKLTENRGGAYSGAPWKTVPQEHAQIDQEGVNDGNVFGIPKKCRPWFKEQAKFGEKKIGYNNEPILLRQH